MNFVRTLMVVLAFSASAHAAPPNAVMLTNACSGCHGGKGVSAGPHMPNLAGQRKESFVVAMKAFRSGERPSTIMGRLAQGYSDAEIEAMGEFYAVQLPVRQTAPVDARLAQKGRIVYLKQCKYCHLDNRDLWNVMHTRGEYDRVCGNCHKKSGPDAKDHIPVIAGQWLEYLRIQMRELKDGVRRMPESKAKRMNLLSREEIEAVVHFCASQAAE